MAGHVRYERVIGATIRKYRQVARLTQEELAEKAGFHPVYIGELERGEEKASVAALMKIAKALRVRLQDIVADV